MNKSVSMRISEKTNVLAGELQEVMGVTSKAAAVGLSLQITKQLSDILNSGNNLYYIDKDGDKNHLLISSLHRGW